MSNTKSKKTKSKTGLARCMELASDRKGLIFLSALLSSLAAIASFIPYIAVYFMIREILNVFPDLVQLDMGRIMNYGWLALAGIVANILLYFLAIFSSHIAAFGTLYDLKVLFADHITKIPLGYHLTIGSGRLRKIMDENIESVEGFIAHQFPDFVASITAPIVMVIILFVVASSISAGICTCPAISLMSRKQYYLSHCYSPLPYPEDIPGSRICSFVRKSRLHLQPWHLNPAVLLLSATSTQVRTLWPYSPDPSTSYRISGIS